MAKIQKCKIKRDDAIDMIIDAVRKNGGLIKTKYFYHKVSEDGELTVDTFHGIHQIIITEDGFSYIDDDIILDYFYIFGDFGEAEYILTRDFAKGIYEKYAEMYAQEYEIPIEEVTYEDVFNEYRCEIADELEDQRVEIAKDLVRTVDSAWRWDEMTNEQVGLILYLVTGVDYIVIDDDE